MGLNDALRALERAAADVAALLPDDLPEAALLELSAAWGWAQAEAGRRKGLDRLDSILRQPAARTPAGGA